MPEKKRLNINDAPKWFRAIYLIAPVFGLILVGTDIDNDFFFIYKTGEYIVNNGFPTTDFLSMHSSMQIIAQQWLSAVIYYFAYELLGKAGVIMFVMLCYSLFCVLMYRLTQAITDNPFIAGMVSLAADLLAATMFETSRPQAITMLLILLELLMLECFVKKGKIVYLCILPLISLALINLHAAMWAMMFVFAAPYVAAAIPFKFKSIRREPCCSFVKLLICGVVCFAAGFINPYGFKAMTYILTSFGYDEISNNIFEMRSPSVSDPSGAILFISLAVFACIAIFFKKRAFTTRFVLLFAGTALMALMNAKSIAYFIVGGIPAFSYLLKDAEIILTIDEGKRSKQDRKKLTVLITLFVVMIGVLAGTVIYQSGNTESTDTKMEYEYEALDEIIEILEKENKDDIILYTGFNHGQYLEFYGYHPYIDGRAELFLEDNNGDFNYLKEYFDVNSANIYYKDFVDKYHFNYLIVNDSNQYLLMSLTHDDDYEILYESDYATLFKLKQ